MAAYLAGDLEMVDPISREMVSSARVPMRQCKKWKPMSAVGESNWHKGAQRGQIPMWLTIMVEGGTGKKARGKLQSISQNVVRRK
jgi:hypothetical protein